MTTAAATKTTVVDSKLQALIDENKKLTKKLARLQKLDKEVNGGGKDKKDEKSTNILTKKTDLAEIRQAFDQFDVDASGYIDKDEFAQLSSSLGIVLDDSELAAAVKAIDTSGDGKISFNEFVRWWGSAKATDKNATKLFALRTLLHARAFANLGKSLVSSLKSSKSTSSDTLKHHFGVSVGAAGQTKAGLKVGVKFGAKDALFSDLQADAIVRITAELRSDLTEANAKKAVETVGEFLKDAPFEHKESVDHKEKTFTLAFAPPVPDPFAAAAQMGIDLSGYIQEVSLSLGSTISLEDLLEAPKDKSKTLVDVFGITGGIDVQIKKSILRSLAEITRDQSAYFFALCKSSNLTIDVGSMATIFKDFVAANKDKTIYDPAKKAFLKVAQAATDNDHRDIIKKGFLKVAGRMLEEPLIAMLAKLVKDNLSQLKKVEFLSSSGASVNLDVNNLLLFKYIPDVEASNDDD